MSACWGGSTSPNSTAKGVTPLELVWGGLLQYEIVASRQRERYLHPSMFQEPTRIAGRFPEQRGSRGLIPLAGRFGGAAPLQKENSRSAGWAPLSGRRKRITRGRPLRRLGGLMPDLGIHHLFWPSNEVFFRAAFDGAVCSLFSSRFTRHHTVVRTFVSYGALQRKAP